MSAELWRQVAEALAASVVARSSDVERVIAFYERQAADDLYSTDTRVVMAQALALLRSEWESTQLRRKADGLCPSCGARTAHHPMCPSRDPLEGAQP